MSKAFPPIELSLSNGIPVILQHYEGAVAATYWWVQTGSSDEAPAEAGFAHFLEHMLFKDAAAKETGKDSTGQMARAIESLGGEINAYTSFDQTVYHVTCAATHWEKVVDVFGTMAKPQKFLNSDFKREREVILEELRKNLDSPSRQMFQTLFSTTFAKHPYGKPVIGFVKTLNAAKVGDLDSFYRRNYVSSRMGLIMVGPLFEPGTSFSEVGDPLKSKRVASIMKLLEKRFGGSVIKKATSPRRPRPVEPELRSAAVKFVTQEFDVKTPTFAFSFRAPSLSHEDVPALDLLASVLAMGELSRLYQKLFYGTSVVTDVSGGLYIPSDPGMLYFQTETADLEKLPQAAEQAFRELARLAEEGPTDEEMKRVLVNAESERLYSTQTADGVAGRLGFLKFILGDLEFDRQYLEDIRAVDKARIQEMARRYFDPRRLSGVVLLPKGSLKAGFDAKVLAAYAESILKSPAEPAKLPAVRKSGSSIRPESFTLPSGIRVMYRENPMSHVMSVHAAALGGLRMELGQPVTSREQDWGSSHMMSMCWTKGTQGQSSTQIAAVVEGSAAGMDGFAGRNTVGLQMTGLARDWKPLSGLFGEVLADPSFPKDEVDHSRRVAEDSVRGIEDHSSQVCSKLFLETLFEHHPYGRMTTGSLESLAAIDSAKLQAFHRRWIRPESLVVSVVGAVKRAQLDQWLPELERQVVKLASTSKAEPIPASLSEEPALKAPRWVEKSFGREQLHIIAGGFGTHLNSPDRYALQLLQTLLGGQSGRLFIELREKKSLAYTVSPVSFEGVERGYVGTYIACSPQKRQEAIDGIRKVHEILAAKGPTAAEVNRAKEFLLGRRAMDLQSDSSLAAHYGLEAVYGLPYLDELEYARKIQKIGAKEIQAICRRYLVEPFQVTSVVG